MRAALNRPPAVIENALVTSNVSSAYARILIGGAKRDRADRYRIAGLPENIPLH